MSGKLKNAFILASEGFTTDGIAECVKTVATENFGDYAKISALYDNVYAPWCDESVRAGAKSIYVPSLDLSDKSLDKLIEYTLDNDVSLAVKCSQTLTEAGRIDSRFSRSPVMLLHEFGLLNHSTVISGVYLDKDDLALMAQEGTPLAVLPTYDSGCGFGVAPVCAALGYGVKIGIGTCGGEYNRNHNVIYEAAALRLLVSAQMNKRDAVSVAELAKMCAVDGATENDLKQIENEISSF